MSGARARTVALLLGAALLAAPAPRASAAPSASDVRTAAERWCAQALARAWARPGVDAFVAGRVDSSRGFWFVHVGQRWRGLAVEPVDVCVTLDARGTVLRSNGTLVPRPEPAGAWTLGATEAEARGRQAAAVRSAPVGAAERVLALSGGALRPAYRVRSAPMPGLEPNELIVDAERGDVLIARGGAWHAVGNVYPSDGRDTLATVTLTGLDAGDSVLSGPLVRAEDGTLRQLVGPNGDFRLTPSVPDTTQFDEVNVWWYVQQYLAWLGSRGYRGFPDTLHVRTHAAIAPNVAYTSGNYVLLADSVTNFAHDAARARDVVTHELQHFVSEGYGLVHGSREGDALQEGLSDYMAAACTGDARIGEWEYRLYPNGVTTVASDPAVFNYANLGQVSWGGVEAGSTWADGMIFSGALWDLRTQLGATADSLVLEALPRIPSSPTFGEFAAAMVDADAILDEGANRAAVEHAFGGRDIVPNAVLTAFGPDSLWEGQPGTFTLVGTGVVNTGQARWTVTRRYSDGRVDSLVDVGTGSSLTYGDTTNFVLTARAPNDWGGTSVAQWAVHLRVLVLHPIGPALLQKGQPGTFSLAPDSSLSGTAAVWRVRPHCAAPPCQPLVAKGGGWAFSHGDSISFDVEVEAQDIWGGTGSGILAVAVVPTVLHASAPTTLEMGRPGSFSLVQDSTLSAALPQWLVRPHCTKAPCQTPVLKGTGWSISYRDSSSFDVVVVAQSAWGFAVRETLAVVVTPPVLHASGPTRLDAGQPGSFALAADSTINPNTVQWMVRLHCAKAPCPVPILMGTGSSFTCRDSSSFDVVVVAKNWWGVAARESLTVTVNPPVLHLTGPTQLMAGVLGGYGLVADSTISPIPAQWLLRPHCAFAPCAKPVLMDTGWSFTHRDSLGFDVVVVGQNQWGVAARESLAVAVTPYTMKIQGPQVMVVGLPGTFSVVPSTSLAGAPNWTLWRLRSCAGGSCDSLLASGAGWTFTHTDTFDFRILAVAQNVFGVPVKDSLTVRVDTSQVALRGPHYFTGQLDTLRYTAVSSGPLPWSFKWYTSTLDGRSRLLHSLASTYTLHASAPFLLEVDVRDGLGVTTVGTQPVRLVAASIAGPALVDPDAPGVFTSTLDTTYTDLAQVWSVRRHCVGTACDTTWKAIGSGRTFTHATRTDYDLQMMVVGPETFRLAARTNVQVTPPRAHVVAAGALAGAGLTYKADAGGAGPFTFLWHRLPATGTGSAQLLGRGPTALVATPPPYRVRLLVTDVNNRSAADTLLVAADTTADSSAAAPAAGERLGLTCSSATSAGLVVLLWGPATELARLTVFDVSGREVAEWYAGPFAGGSRLLMRQTGALAQGAYFLRWQAGGARAVRRFVVLR